MKQTPPMGVIAPMERTPVSASVYRLPEKISTPASRSQQTLEAAETEKLPERGSRETTSRPIE